MATAHLVVCPKTIRLMTIKQLMDGIEQGDKLERSLLYFRSQILGDFVITPAWNSINATRAMYQTELWMRCPHLGPQAQKIESDSAQSEVGAAHKEPDFYN